MKMTNDNFDKNDKNQAICYGKLLRAFLRAFLAIYFGKALNFSYLCTVD